MIGFLVGFAVLVVILVVCSAVGLALNRLLFRADPSTEERMHDLERRLRVNGFSYGP